MKMGVCYDAELIVKFNDETKAIDAIKNYIWNDTNTDYGLEQRKAQGISLNSFDDLAKIFLVDHTSGHVKKQVGPRFTTYSNGFDATYGWENVITGMFQQIAPYLDDGSALMLNPDNEYTLLRIENGKCIQEI